MYLHIHFTSLREREREGGGEREREKKTPRSVLTWLSGRRIPASPLRVISMERRRTSSDSRKVVHPRFAHNRTLLGLGKLPGPESCIFSR